MRRNFAQVLKAGKIDLKNEYTKFYDLFYSKDSKDNKSMEDIVSNNFTDYYFRGTCLTLEEFNETYGFKFEKQPQNFNEDYLVCFMEYTYNLIFYLNNTFYLDHIDMFYLDDNDKSFYLNQIQRVIDVIGYVRAEEDGFIIFVPKDNNAIAVAESKLIPDNISYKVLEYNHHTMKGNIESKKETLIKFADILEPKRVKLNEINKSFTSDLFQLINSCNIRHNNRDKDSNNYRKYIAEINNNELEHIYDEIYQMCLLAFMQLEHTDRKDWIEETKNNIVSIK